jgi:DNA polymerase (family X)
MQELYRPLSNGTSMLSTPLPNPLSNREIAERFITIADILEIQGEGSFKVRAYRVAAEVIYGLDEELSTLHTENRLAELPGFGPAIVGKTQDFLTTGTTDIWERIKEAVPLGVVQIARLKGLGPKSARTLWESLSVTTIDELETAAHEKKVRALAGFGPTTETNLLEAIAAYRRLNERMPHARALKIAEGLKSEISKIAGVEKIEIGGDLRAGRDTVDEIVLIVTGKMPETPATELPIRLLATDNEAEMGSIPPELRHWDDIITLAKNKQLPKLIVKEDIRGQLHEHTTWSDGTASVREMAEAALQLGYEYLAITDHSPLVTVANGLNRERLLAQIAEIHTLQLEFAARGLTLFTGLEVDILADGSLDMDDETLSKLDIVVASVHRRYKQDKNTMTERVCKALTNPHVHILGHPTGRLLGEREAFEIDMEAVISMAAKYGKAMEINSTKERMDMNDTHAKMAKENGVKISINCDAHTTHHLGDLYWGMCMARRAGLEAGDVINTYSIKKLKDWLVGIG